MNIDGTYVNKHGKPEPRSAWAPVWSAVQTLVLIAATPILFVGVCALALFTATLDSEGRSGDEER